MWQLKPPCVELSQVTLHFKGKKATPKDVIIALESLHQTLKDVTRQDYALDSKLAEYVFFPLSHIFQENKTIPVRATELALQCLQILISRGWRNSITPDLAKQLLILLSFLAGGSVTEAECKDVNEELAAAAFSCLGSLFRASNAAGLSSDGSVDAANFPVLGHTVSVLLDGVGIGPSVKVRLGALSALDALLSSISDKEATKSFFPGIVSALTKLLSAGSRSKGSYRILQGSLDVLTQIILEVVSDHTNPEFTPPEQDSSQVAVVPYNHKNRPKDSWLEATSAQVKLALANILPLRYHEKEEVRKALFRLCMSILERCPRSLPQSVPMMIETSLIICTQSSIVDTIELLDNLRIVVTPDSSLFEALKSSVHDWIVTLPRVMQSNNETPKKRIVDQISVAFEIISAQGSVSDVLNYAMISNLRASVSAALQTSASKTIQDVAESDAEIDKAVRVHQAKEVSVIFPEVMFTKISQSVTVKGLQSLANKISKSTISTTLQRDVIETLRTTSGDDQIATLWLAIQMQSKHEDDIDVFLNPIAADPEQSNPILDDLYSFSLAVLSELTYTTENDWRLQALSLQAIALQAQQQRQDFRPELVDALYPILERMGSPNAALQKHAITAHSIVSTACSYPSPKDLIIENVDYLVNAVALKLNTFDISPQAPQVLTMMIKLCGATLIPYLDDLVESIFAILECYHGYPKLVEQMFSVLNAIVEEGNKAAAATAITSTAEPSSRIQIYKPTTIASLASQLKQARIEKPHLDPLPSPPPDTDHSPSTPSSPLEEAPQQKSDDTPPLPKPLLTISSIATLTQHHLPTSSPSLRLLLLNLLPRAFFLLSPYTDHFLPIINLLWPVLIARLYDPEAYITTAAAHALAALCKAAGEFLASRFRDEWERIGALYARCRREAAVERRRMGRVGGVLGRREGAVGGLVLGAVEWVGAEGEMEEGLWEMVEGVVGEGGGREGRSGLRDGRRREVLEGLNADMLWVVEERERVRRGGRALEKPVVEGVVFGDVDL